MSETETLCSISNAVCNVMKKYSELKGASEREVSKLGHSKKKIIPFVLHSIGIFPITAKKHSFFTLYSKLTNCGRDSNVSRGHVRTKEPIRFEIYN